MRFRNWDRTKFRRTGGHFGGGVMFKFYVVGQGGVQKDNLDEEV